MSEPMAYNALDGALWVFPDGPNHAGYYLGCADSEDVSEPLGEVTLTFCFNGKGQWQVVGKKTAPPGAITTTINTLTYRQRNYLEKIKCTYGLMYLQNEGGRSDLFCNHQRALILDSVYNTEKTYANFVKREASDESTHGFAISANPPAIDVAIVQGNQTSINELSNVNDVFMLRGTCDPCLEGVAVADGTGVYSASQVWLTHDGGQTWVPTPTSPFFAATDLTSCVLVDMCAGVRRIIVSQEPPGAAQGHMAYSDDDGATWIEVHIGGAAEGAGGINGLFALDSHHIWLASVGGYIYFSADGGETWTAQESHVITAGVYHKVAFMPDGLHGYAVAAAGIVAVSVNGGSSWTAATVIAGTPDLYGLAVTDDDKAWVGALWFTEDGGVTWTQRTGFVGSGAGLIQAISFANAWVGYFINGTGVWRTIDGGYTWDPLTVDPNLGLNALVACDENYAVMVGDIYNGYGFAGVVEE